MKKILYSILTTTALIAASCNESNEDKNKLAGMTTNPISIEDNLEFVKVYEKGDTLELFVRNQEGTYRVDRAANAYLSSNERAILGFYFFRYDCFVPNDSMALMRFYGESDWPNGAYVRFNDRLDKEQEAASKAEYVQANNNRRKNISNGSLESMTFIRSNNQLTAKHTVNENGVLKNIVQKFQVDSLIKFIK